MTLNDSNNTQVVRACQFSITLLLVGCSKISLSQLKRVCTKIVHVNLLLYGDKDRETICENKDLYT